MNIILNSLSTIIIMVLTIYLVIKLQKDRLYYTNENKIDIRTLKKGDHVVTIGGLHGEVDSIDEVQNIVCIDCEGVYFNYDIHAIKEIIETEEV